jgi:hypothetical protein
MSKSLLQGSDTHIFNFKPELSADALFASINAAARRSSHSFILEQVTRQTPSHLEYADYSPFIDAARNHIPRVFWSGKPEERLGNWFGKRYGFINPDDQITSWNMPWISEFYLIYGYIKAALLSFAIGGVFAFLVQLISSIRPKAVGFGIFSASMLPLFHQESNFSVMTGNFLTVSLFLAFSAYVFMYLYKKLNLAAGRR